jgi:maltose O-acetyltransferase
MNYLKKIFRTLLLIYYYSFLQFLPINSFPVIGKICRQLRYSCVKHLFFSCGKNVNVERRAYFGSGRKIKIGNNSGIGVNCVVPSDIVIGENVMMGPNCFILAANHDFSRVDIPMIQQGHSKAKITIIEDDVWIGRQVLFTPGRLVKKGSIIAAGCVLTKNFPEYSVIGGNPSSLIRNRN